MSKRRVVAVLLQIACLFNTSFCQKDSEEFPHFWNDGSRKTLHEALARKNIDRPARNVIVFIGDGMGLTTLTAGRIYKGQARGNPGEETVTSLGRLPNVGLAKVYSVDAQTPDSASTATAILSGVKTRNKLLGLSGKSRFKSCASVKGNELKSILHHSADAGKWTGVVTNTQVQHATPAASYAHAPTRSWTADHKMEAKDIEEGCKDIALQLTEMGRKINVVLGGGRAYMKPQSNNEGVHGSASKGGLRRDGRDLINEWKKMKPNEKARYIWNKQQLDSVNANETDYLLGLFKNEDMSFEHERDIKEEPSLTEMTLKAIEILSRNPKGYFLLVEGGKIDHAHHANTANIAMSEFVAFEKAVEAAQNATSLDETLILVTADHGHVFTIGGYSDRGNPIGGFARNHVTPSLARDGKPYTSLGYTDGPGYYGNGNRGNGREKLSYSRISDFSYRYQTSVPLSFESHSGEDTVVLAGGPMSHLLRGVYEQNYIGHVLMYASCVGLYNRSCKVDSENNQTTKTNVTDSTTQDTSTYSTAPTTGYVKTTSSATSKEMSTTSEQKTTYSINVQTSALDERQLTTLDANTGNLKTLSTKDGTYPPSTTIKKEPLPTTILPSSFYTDNMSSKIPTTISSTTIKNMVSTEHEPTVNELELPTISTKSHNTDGSNMVSKIPTTTDGKTIKNMVSTKNTNKEPVLTIISTSSLNTDSSNKATITPNSIDETTIVNMISTDTKSTITDAPISTTTLFSETDTSKPITKPQVKTLYTTNNNLVTKTTVNTKTTKEYLSTKNEIITTPQYSTDSTTRTRIPATQTVKEINFTDGTTHQYSKNKITTATTTGIYTRYPFISIILEQIKDKLIEVFEKDNNKLLEENPEILEISVLEKDDFQTITLSIGLKKSEGLFIEQSGDTKCQTNLNQARMEVVIPITVFITLSCVIFITIVFLKLFKNQCRNKINI